MNKGQLSIDLMMSGIAALVIITSFIAITNNFIENQKEISINNQLKISATQAATFITSSQAMGKPQYQGKFADNYIYPIHFKAKTKINPIIIDGQKINPIIAINTTESKITATINYKGKTFSQTARFGYADESNTLTSKSPYFRAIINYDESNRILQVCSEGDGCNQ